jgi:acyl carrier protein
MTSHILDDLIAIVRHFNDREYSGFIGPETYFFADLGMTSIDAVVLAEKLEQYYAQKVPFHSFLSNLKQKQARDLQLGELADFLEQHINKKI